MAKDFFMKMSSEEFMRKVVELYIEARFPRFYHPKIKRGRSHVIPGQVEDLLAAFFAFNLVSDYEYFVDQAITTGKTALYPDVAIAKDKKIDNIVDIKMDLGWNRDGFVAFCEEQEKKLDDINRKDCFITDGIKKEKALYKFGDDVKYHVVVVSDQNISSEKFERNMKGVEKLTSVKAYSLSAKLHPNTYNKTIDEIIKGMTINNNEFIRLLESVC